MAGVIGLLALARPTAVRSHTTGASHVVQRRVLRGAPLVARARPAVSLVAARKPLVARATMAPEAPTAPAPEQNEWARVTEAGVLKATELWEAARVLAGVALPARGDWDGLFPTQRVWLSDVMASPKRPKFMNREWKKEDITYAAVLGATHIAACFAPFCFSWANLGAMLIGWVITGMLGITLSYHRQLSHKAFATPKWLEYTLAYCGVMAMQGDPLEWVSSHRYHHLYTDTPQDPHTPYEGFWWSHCGWFLDIAATERRVGNRSNASDMAEQPFYRWIQATYGWHIVAAALATYLLGGWGGFVWAFALRVCWVHHITWFVNSACHVWGNQQYHTGDLSRNNWWVGILAFGEGWHNNHHAFEFSCRHGLEWYQFDPTWYTIKVLEFFGLADKLKYPSQKQMSKLRIAAA